MGTALSALRDATFGRKVVNFVISVYALTALGAAIFTSGGLRDGIAQPAVEGHEHIVRFMRWVGLSEVAEWFQAKLVEPMASHPETVGLAGVLLVLFAIGIFCLQRPPIYAIPAQPAYGVVLGVALFVDFGDMNVWLASTGAVLGVFGGLFVLGHEGGTPWDAARAQEPLVHATGSLFTALFSAPGVVLSFITVAPTSPPARVAITSLPRGRET